MSIYARFLFADDLKDNHAVRLAAFKPAKSKPDSGRMEGTSVMLQDECELEDVLTAANCVAQMRKNKGPVVAKGCIAHSEITGLGLLLDQYDEDCFPKNLHHDIVNWPTDKQKRNELADTLAEIASNHLHRFPVES